jgi:hypothetical protein
MARIGYRRIRAPQEDGAALIDPPLPEIPALVRANQAKSAEWDRLSGASFSVWRREAHVELIRQCKGAATRYAPLPDSTGSKPHAVRLRDRPVILSGHQPALFHPGVWFKNFLLSEICRLVEGAGVNLIIDNDLSTPSSIQVPSGSAHSPSLTGVSLDGGIDEEPWETRAIAERNYFLSFRQRVLTEFTLRPAELQSSLLDRLWEKVVPQVHAFEKDHGPDVWYTPFRRLITLGEVLAQARHELELELGLRKYELALSSFTRWNPFRAFAGHLLARAAEFQAIHNQALQQHRLLNRIRSQSHPVPELETDSEWIEAPLWIWTSSNRRRRRAFVRRVGADWELSDRMGTTVGPWWVDGNPPRGAAESPDLVHVRPRALLTTMFARLVMSDLFIHGIGGAKYDELTDSIIRRFFGVEPPAYVTATATFRLPIDRPDVSQDDLRASAERLRAIRYRPETLLKLPLVARDSDLVERLSALAAEKRDYVARHDLRRCAPAVYQRLEALNAAMRALLRPVEEQLTQQHTALQQSLAQAKLFGSREFSFVLFNSEILPARLLDLCKVSS